MNSELSLARVGAGQVLCSAGINAGVFGAGVENNEGIFRVVVHKREVAALRQEHTILGADQSNISQGPDTSTVLLYYCNIGKKILVVNLSNCQL